MPHSKENRDLSDYSQADILATAGVIDVEAILAIIDKHYLALASLLHCPPNEIKIVQVYDLISGNGHR